MSEVGQVEHSQTTLEYLRSAANSPRRSEAAVETDRETHQQVLTTMSETVKSNEVTK